MEDSLPRTVANIGDRKRTKATVVQSTRCQRLPSFCLYFAGALVRTARMNPLFAIFSSIKRPTTCALLLAAISLAARASDLVPYIAMPVGSGYATDTKGVRHPSEFCLRDAVFAPPLPYSKAFIPGGNPTKWNWTLQGSGMYRLDIATRTGLVSQVTIQWDQKSPMI